MRVTTNSTVRNYNSTMSTSLSTLNTARERVSTHQKFSRAYEDPSGASRAAQLHRDYFRADGYLAVVKDTQSRMDSAEGTLQQIVTIVGGTLGDETLQGINGASSPETKQTYATSLRELQQSLLQFSNATYQDEYLFAGADGGNMAFTKGDDGAILYRGINVTTGEWTGHTNQEGLAELDRLSEEKLFIDIGLGLKTNTGGVATNSSDFNGSSAYDKSLSGIECFGFGTAKDSDISKNLIALIGQMADELDKPSFDMDRFGEMRDQLKLNHDQLTNFEANMGVKDVFLTNTKTQLDTDKLSLYSQMDAIENIQPAEAIMDYSYSQYAYNMVLKVGSSLLTSSLLDFMK